MMKKHNFIFSILLILLQTISAMAQLQPDSSQFAAWKSFNRAHANQWTIHWNPKTGTPAFIYGSKTEPVTGLPSQAAQRFLRSIRRLFKMPANLSNLKNTAVQENRGKYHVKFQQTYKSVPIHAAEFQVHLLSDGRVDFVNGRYYRHITAPMVPKITTQSAISTALSDLGQPNLRRAAQSELVIYPGTDSFHLAWEINLSTLAPYGEWTFLVDAISGAILKKRNDLDYVDGSGDVYLTHPELTPNTTTVTLRNLDGSGYLRGTYANVHQFCDPPGCLDPNQNRAFSATNQFFLVPVTHFLMKLMSTTTSIFFDSG